MEKEIDVRALMMDKLSCEYRVENCAAFARGNEEMKYLGILIKMCGGQHLVRRNLLKASIWDANYL